MEKEIKEKRLTELLKEALESVGMEDGIIKTIYDPESNTFTATFDVVEVPEDNYIGFSGY